MLNSLRARVKDDGELLRRQEGQDPRAALDEGLPDWHGRGLAAVGHSEQRRREGPRRRVRQAGQGHGQASQLQDEASRLEREGGEPRVDEEEPDRHQGQQRASLVAAVSATVRHRVGARRSALHGPRPHHRV